MFFKKFLNLKIKKFLFFISATLSISTQAETNIVWGYDEKMRYYLPLLKKFKKETEQKYSGRIRIKIVSYKVTDYMKSDIAAEKQKNIDINQFETETFEKESPALLVHRLPFIFRNDIELETYLQSQNSEKHLSLIDSSNIVPIDYILTGGFVYIYGPKQVNTISDVKDKKFYTFNSESGYTKKYFLPLGINAIPMLNYIPHQNDYGEIDSFDDFMNLKGKENFVLSISKHRVITSVLFMKKQKLSQLSTKDQKSFLSDLKNFAATERNFIYQRRESQLNQMNSSNAKIYVWKQEDWDKSKELFSNIFKELPSVISSELNYIQQIKVDQKSLKLK